VGLENHKSAHGILPIGSEVKPIDKSDAGASGIVGTDGVFKNAFVALLPFIEQQQLWERYNSKLPWYYQDADVARTVIPGFICPSNDIIANPWTEPFFVTAAKATRSPLGGELALATYVFSKGTNDAYCRSLDEIPVEELGMFDYASSIQEKQIVDGLSRTFAMGEAANGPHWQLCSADDCEAPDLATPDPRYTDGPYFARQFWIGSGNVRLLYDSPVHLALTGNFACTLAPLNKFPVTHFLYDDVTKGQQCRGSLGNSANTHRVPNFRSDHAGGGYFLMGDGSVTFVTATIAIPVYRALSTIAGGEAEEGG
jgi:hypothetical protein